MDSMSGEGGYKLHEINGEEKWAQQDYWKGLTHVLARRCSSPVSTKILFADFASY